MNRRDWTLPIGAAFGAAAAGFVIRDFLPEQWAVPPETEDAPLESLSETASFPSIDVTFLRCGVTTVRELVAVRGGTLKPVRIAYSAVLVHHPAARFLYDTGLCTEISGYLARRSFLFRHTLASFTSERSIAAHLCSLNLTPPDLSFALLSHLHWDHVGGIPDLPGLQLRINRVEHEAAKKRLLDANRGLVRELIRDNPIELFDHDGPAYEGFPASLDLLGDGSLLLVPLPGHTAGHTGLFVNRSNGPRLLLIGDAGHVAANYLRPATMHPWLWKAVTSDDAAARKTLLDLHQFSRGRPEVELIAMHDAAAQARIMASPPAARPSLTA